MLSPWGKSTEEASQRTNSWSCAGANFISKVSVTFCVSSPVIGFFIVPSSSFACTKILYEGAFA
ncbi:MAG: hypothetical protein J5687_06870 [Treponema sp.]|nr:hypothetical protein [Treponema sp.]